jgi:hypothetical protein
VHEKPEKRDVMIDINPEGKYDDEKKEEKQLYEKPEKRDVMVDINTEGEYDDNNPVEDDREHLIKGDGFEDTERIKDEGTEGTRDEGSNDEDEKRGEMLKEAYQGKNDASKEEDQEDGEEDDENDEDDDGESIEERDSEWVSDDEIKNSSEEEAGFKDTSENADEKPEEDDENDDKKGKQPNTQWVDMHNQLGVAQGHDALDNKTTECVDMIIKKEGFESTKEMKDEELEKREAMLTNPDSKYNEVDQLMLMLLLLQVDVVMKKDNLRQRQGKQCPYFCFEIFVDFEFWTTFSRRELSEW